MASSTTSTSWLPLTTDFTPPPECSSLTIVHSQRYIAFYRGCVGADPSCCLPRESRTTSAFSPGRCPGGYVTQDPHCGLDRLGTDRVEWEATCVPSGFSTCTPRRGLPPALPFDPNPWCRSPYTAARPDLESPVTAVVLYCEPYDYRLDSSFSVWCNRVGHRSTTTVTSEWFVLPATSVPRALEVSHIVVRWREGDVMSGPAVAPHPTPGPGLEKPSVPPNPTQKCTSGPDCSPSDVPLSPPPPLSTAPDRFRSAIPGLVVGVFLVVLGLYFAIMFYRKRMRRKAAFQEIEIEDTGPNIGCHILHQGIIQRDGEIVAEPTADIVLVHGFNGHRIRTWTKDGCCWPRDLLPRTLPGVRVITFGYDSRILRWMGTSRNSVGRHATALLNDLSQIREQCPRRPIIFVGHSLGGIVVKDALHKAREPDETRMHRPILEHTRGIIFLGTPHHGSGYARLGWLGSSVSWIFGGMNLELLRTLRQDSEILERINTDFRNTLIYHSRRESQIQICSFAEELPVLGALGFRVVVPSRSAFIGLENERQLTIWANHRDICRYSSEDDIGYWRVRRWIVEFVALAQPRNSSIS